MIADILVGYIQSHGAAVAFEHALEIAIVSRARVQLVTVTEEGEPGDDSGLLPTSQPRLTDLVEPTTEDLEPPVPGSPEFLEQARLRCLEAHVACATRRLMGEPARRLRERARLAQLTVIGRRQRRGLASRRLGRTTRGILTLPAGPLLVGTDAYRELRAGALIYEATAAGGRALNFAGELVTLLNGTLDILAPASDRRDGQRLVEDATFARRPYHLDGECEAIEGAPADVILRVGMERRPDFLVVPAPPPRWWNSEPADALKAALEIPDVVAIIVP